MMEWYLSDSFNGRLLCDVLKDRVLGKSRPLMDRPDGGCVLLFSFMSTYRGFFLPDCQLLVGMVPDFSKPFLCGIFNLIIKIT